MSTPPPVNPDIDAIAHRVKHAYAVITQQLAAISTGSVNELAPVGPILRNRRACRKT